MNEVCKDKAIGNEGRGGHEQLSSSYEAHSTAPISFPVSAGSARNETVSKDQIDGHWTAHCKGGGVAQAWDV